MKSREIAWKLFQVREKSGTCAKTISGQGKSGIAWIIFQVSEKSGNWVKTISGQGKVGVFRENYFRLVKSQRIVWKLFQVSEKSGNCVKPISGQWKVGELSEKIIQVREKSENWVKNTSSQGKNQEIEWKKSSPGKIVIKIFVRKSRGTEWKCIRSGKSRKIKWKKSCQGFQWKIPQVREVSRNWMKSIASQGKVGELCEE